MNRQIILFKLLVIISSFLCCTTQKEIAENVEKIEPKLIPAFVINGIDSKNLTIEEGMKKYKVPAVSIAFFDKGKIKWTETYGTISKNNSKLVNEQTLFQAASISKPLTSLGVMKLVQAGEVMLDENVNKYLNGWNLQNEDYEVTEKTTLRHLLSHSAGITDLGFEGYQQGTNLPTLLQVLNGESSANSKKIIQKSVAGKSWKYSSGGFAIIQKLIEGLSNDSFQNYMEREVFNPIGMKVSTFNQHLTERLKENVAFGHDGEGNTIEGNWRLHPAQAAAGLWTTPSELAQFAISLQEAFSGQSQQLLYQKTMQTMLEKQLGDWGLGIDISNKDNVLRFMHGGANGGYRCHLVAEANMGQGVVIMTNGVGGESLIQDLLRGISKEYDWNIYKPREKSVVRLSNSQKEKLTGKYFMVDNNQVIVDISKIERGLKVLQTWNGQSYRILPEESLQFFRETDGISIEFKENNEGKALTFLAGGELLFKKL